jgi:2-iminobutanoate/2-iminopropanoate deaminase
VTRIPFGPPIDLPLTHAIGTEHFIFVTGQVGSGPDGSYPDDMAVQTRVALEKMGALLEAAGSSFDKVVKTTVFITDIDAFAEMNAVYRTFFTDVPPARSTIGCKLVDAGAKVEIEAIALR